MTYDEETSSVQFKAIIRHHGRVLKTKTFTTTNLQSCGSVYDDRPMRRVYHAHGLQHTDLNTAWGYSVLI